MGSFSAEEVGLAFHNVAMPLEALRYDVTPPGLHYTLSHFDIPALDEATFVLQVGGCVMRPLTLSLGRLRAMPARTVRVTLECAGNGRAGMTPRYPSMPWAHGAVGTAEWTGAPLRDVLDRARLRNDAVEVAFIGADRGFDAGVEHSFARSLAVSEAMAEDVLLAWAMNGSPLLPQHGAPMRLIVPGWFGMASVKWLERIEVLDRAFDGYQQMVYHLRKFNDDPGVPIRHLLVKSLILPPGIPDGYSRRRLVDAGRIELRGRAWAGNGIGVRRVEVAVNGAWQEADLEPSRDRYAWQGWRFDWEATPGEYLLTCRATDGADVSQPISARWNASGMCNNAVHSVALTVR